MTEYVGIYMILSRKICLAAMILLLCACSCAGSDFTVQVLAMGEGGAQITGKADKQVPFGDAVSFAVTVPAGEDVVQVFLDDVLTEEYHISLSTGNA